MIYSSLKVDLQPIPKRRIYNWSRGDWTEINEKAEYFCNFFTTNYNIDTPINQLWNEFKNFCSSILDIIPSKFTTNRSNPWITHSVKNLSKRKQRMYNHARLSHHCIQMTGHYIIKLRKNVNVNAAKHMITMY